MESSKKSAKVKMTFQNTIDQEIIFCAKKHKNVIMLVVIILSELVDDT